MAEGVGVGFHTASFPFACAPLGVLEVGIAPAAAPSRIVAAGHVPLHLLRDGLRAVPLVADLDQPATLARLACAEQASGASADDDGIKKRDRLHGV